MQLLTAITLLAGASAVAAVPAAKEPSWYHKQCSTRQVKKDIAVIDAKFKHPIDTCEWYLSAKRVKSPLKQFGVTRFTDGCECLTKKKAATKAGPTHVKPKTFTPTCAKAKKTALKNKLAKEAKQPIVWCEFWGYGTGNSWRTTSPFPSLTNREIYDSCLCWNPPKVTTTSSAKATVYTTSSKTPSSTSKTSVYSSSSTSKASSSTSTTTAPFSTDAPSTAPGTVAPPAETSGPSPSAGPSSTTTSFVAPSIVVPPVETPSSSSSSSSSSTTASSSTTSADAGPSSTTSADADAAPAPTPTPNASSSSTSSSTSTSASVTPPAPTPTPDASSSTSTSTSTSTTSTA